MGAWKPRAKLPTHPNSVSSLFAPLKKGPRQLWASILAQPCRINEEKLSGLHAKHGVGDVSKGW